MVDSQSILLRFSILFQAALILAATVHCEHPKQSALDSIALTSYCDLLAVCQKSDAKFGMIGDSWTDFAGGLPVQIDLHDWLVKRGYTIQASVIAGHTAEAELSYVRGFDRVIEQSPHIKYMLVCLGGNDLLANNRNYYVNGTDAEMDARIARLDFVHRSIIAQGDAHKIALWGGEGLTWIFSGYDYTNPDMDQSCVRGSLNAGMPLSQAPAQQQRIIDRYQTYLNSLPARAPNARSIDLRGTLGGPTQSLVGLKFDCIHPNSAGFYLLAQRYAENLEQMTPEK
ncbi:MAG TPA: SGNH/GDSL hydrolase family protein [Leptospiraceae bacterium]|mgnify:FL=1|nr:SGNH/GDSL hydrolase family protein [Leptospirales bacterium]HMU82171.1 SGNH/GDSL hydrolase family protein [Leptospiraceae bacterium]HMW61137.1 SGNH/GDSL hydrolase family protein [Leptospiraceae bacterium]HMX55245.1 SGNH/GDSL hydrolase family protein [Leptospiraceae bacterium]HMZ37248.1 SGNH/GDSL hydrolase family protein [Leptospiraceae bacterium]